MQTDSNVPTRLRHRAKPVVLSTQQRECAALFRAELQQHRASMTPADFKCEPRNFEDWMRSCDSWDKRSLASGLELVEKSVRYGSGSYAKLRSHYRDYARDAMASRYPAQQEPA